MYEHTCPRRNCTLCTAYPSSDDGSRLRSAGRRSPHSCTDPVLFRCKRACAMAALRHRGAAAHTHWRHTLTGGCGTHSLVAAALTHWWLRHTLTGSCSTHWWLRHSLVAAAHTHWWLRHTLTGGCGTHWWLRHTLTGGCGTHWWLRHSLVAAAHTGSCGTHWWLQASCSCSWYRASTGTASAAMVRATTGMCTSPAPRLSTCTHARAGKCHEQTAMPCHARVGHGTRQMVAARCTASCNQKAGAASHAHVQKATSVCAP